VWDAIWAVRRHGGIYGLGRSRVMLYGPGVLQEVIDEGQDVAVVIESDAHVVELRTPLIRDGKLLAPGRRPTASGGPGASARCDCTAPPRRRTAS